MCCQICWNDIRKMFFVMFPASDDRVRIVTGFSPTTLLDSHEFPSAKSGQTGLENGTPICKVGAVCLFYDSTIITVTIIILRLGLLNDQLLIMVYGPNIGHYLVLFIMVTTFRKCFNAFLQCISSMITCKKILNFLPII